MLTERALNDRVAVRRARADFEQEGGEKVHLEIKRPRREDEIELDELNCNEITVAASPPELRGCVYECAHTAPKHAVLIEAVVVEDVAASTGLDLIVPEMLAENLSSSSESENAKEARELNNEPKVKRRKKSGQIRRVPVGKEIQRATGPQEERVAQNTRQV